MGGFGSFASITPVISDTMKIYSNGTWSYTLLPDVIGGAAAVAVQGKIIVGGGYKALTWNSNNQALVLLARMYTSMTKQQAPGPLNSFLKHALF